jgi:hypothetical protein
VAILFIYFSSVLLNHPTFIEEKIMVQQCVNAASTDFTPYNSKKQLDAADVVGR